MPFENHTHAGALQFVDCHGGALTATNEAAAQPGGGRRRQVIVGGKRVKMFMQKLDAADLVVVLGMRWLERRLAVPGLLGAAQAMPQAGH